MIGELEIAADPKALAAKAADLMLTRVLTTPGAFLVSLSGGTPPRLLS
jgi:6-phosphogluconolactonase/glucosamine-6-phosphate isomerase/deaminase